MQKIGVIIMNNNENISLPIYNHLLTILNSNTFMAIINLIFISLIICFGGVIGSYSKICRDGYKNNKADGVNGVRFGIASAFICVPFISSFLHVDYSSMLFPVTDNSIPKFIEQVFLLVSISGISAYLGYALLDGLAAKVLKQQVDDIGKQQKDLAAEQDELKEEVEQGKEIIEKLKKDKMTTHFELCYFKAVSALDKAESLTIQGGEELSVSKKLKEGLSAIDDALSTINRGDVKKDDYDKVLVLKAYILKRLNRIPEALEITDMLIGDGEANPILIYNKACYQYLLRKCLTDNSDIKEMVKQALSIKVTDPEFMRRQEKLRVKVLSKKEEDLDDLFEDSEIEELRSMFKS